jgi:hypothetical protein
MGILMLFGGLIIPIGAFISCRGIVKSWFIALSKYTVFFFIIALIVSVITKIIKMLVDQLMIDSYSGSGNTADNALSNPVFGATLVVGAFGAYMMLKAAEMAQELTGGIASDGAAGATALSNTIKQSGGVAKTIGSSLNKLKQKHSA